MASYTTQTYNVQENFLFLLLLNLIFDIPLLVPQGEISCCKLTN